ncbi:hypothetical protein GCM10008171_04690 [Methylopila jiangsuensis]|uniref:YARHG domain-containing protein n=1 Tax=Methylopila jiangsuensis TaxID=586230 RepID=A0A9W6JG22_9HYPH|nr:YARHG domain-containing protein [Methylopila jiangsuensis]MDR6285457.1 hypothetical protein [Methylopila jiangsuensis]GLK75215.1 hypothetical protein GCM10008171_04690 [Methylopila jiangsuensis]
MRRILLVGVASLVLAAPAAAQSACAELWGERNAVYARAGYCFKTDRAIRAFGNAGCQYDRLEDVPLSDRERARVRDIQREERLLRCPR